jgi:hypothetical protein
MMVVKVSSLNISTLGINLSGDIVEVYPIIG